MKILRKIWEFIKPYVRSVYIFFAKPNTYDTYPDPPYFRRSQSQAVKLISKVMDKIRR